MKPIFALIDCNNFFVSCEQVFSPKIRNKPIIVLSNNDGCIVSRSQEAKNLGIKMGQPAFKCKDILKKYHVQIFSGNFALYSNMSKRVMQTIATCKVPTEIYSVDEAFLDLSAIPKKELTPYASSLRQKIKKWTGIPVSIGIGTTKTLAKAANELAKKHSKWNGVCNFMNISDHNPHLQLLPIGDVWGVGRAYHEFLVRNDINTACDLKTAQEKWVKRHMHTPGMRIVLELNETSCFPLNQKYTPRKSITCSRSFGQAITKIKDLESAITSFTIQAAETLREQSSITSSLYIFVRTSFFKKENPYKKSTVVKIENPTAHTPTLIQYAKKALRSIFKEGYEYKKAGIIFSEIIPNNAIQLDFFDPEYPSLKQQKLMKTIDKINKHFGKDSISFSSKYTSKKWQAKKERKSYAYTTKWEELLSVE